MTKAIEENELFLSDDPTTLGALARDKQRWRFREIGRSQAWLRNLKQENA